MWRYIRTLSLLAEFKKALVIESGDASNHRDRGELDSIGHRGISDNTFLSSITRW